MSKTSYRVGDLITETDPFSWLLRVAYWERMCATCFRTSANAPSLLRCSGCKNLRYCSKLCQRNDWRSHKIVCPQISSILASNKFSDADEILLLVQSLFDLKFKLELCCSTEGRVVCGSSHFHSMSDYGADNEIITESDRRIISTVNELSGYSAIEVSKALRLFRANNFGITDSLLNCVGMGVYPHAAILNHSCSPNCILRFTFTSKGPILKVRAVHIVVYVGCGGYMVCGEYEVGGGMWGVLGM